MIAVVDAPTTLNELRIQLVVFKILKSNLRVTKLWLISILPVFLNGIGLFRRRLTFLVEHNFRVL